VTVSHACQPLPAWLKVCQHFAGNLIVVDTFAAELGAHRFAYWCSGCYFFGISFNGSCFLQLYTGASLSIGGVVNSSGVTSYTITRLLLFGCGVGWLV